MGGCGPHSVGSRQQPLMGFCERDDEATISFSISALLGGVNCVDSEGRGISSEPFEGAKIFLRKSAPRNTVAQKNCLGYENQ